MTYLGGNLMDIWVCPWGLSLGVLSHFSFYYEDFHPWRLASWEAEFWKAGGKRGLRLQQLLDPNRFPADGHSVKGERHKQVLDPCSPRAFPGHWRLAQGTCPGTGLAPVLPRERAQGCTFTRVCAGGGLRWELGNFCQELVLQINCADQLLPCFLSQCLWSPLNLW